MGQRVLIPILLSQYGLTSEREPTKLKTGHLRIADNLDFSVPGLVQKVPGSLKVNAAAITGAPTVMAGVHWFPTESTERRVVATGDGKLLKDDMTGAFATTLKSGLDLSRVTSFCVGGGEATGNVKKLFVMNGYDKVQVLAADGAATADLATPPVDWNAAGKGPAFMFQLDTFLIGGGTPTNLHGVYGSTSTNHEDWTTGTVLFLMVYPHIGRKLVAGLEAFSKGFLWKWPRGVFQIQENTGGVASWKARPVNAGIGAAPTPWAVVQMSTGAGGEESGAAAGNDEDAPVAFITSTGTIALMEQTAGTLTGLKFTDICDGRNLNLIDVLRTETNKSRLNLAHLAWDGNERKLRAMFAALGSNAENRELVIDFSGERVKADIVKANTKSSQWLEQDSDGIPQPVFGDNAGFVRKQQVTRAVDGAAYTFRARTAPTDFSDINVSYGQKKLFHVLHLEYIPTGTFDLPCGVYVDGRFKGTVTFSLDSAGSVFPFTLPGVLGGYDLRRKFKGIGGEGYTLELDFQETGQNNPQLARAWVEAELIGMSA